MALLLAVLLALAPEPKLSDADDFNDMVTRAEKDLGCEAYQLMRAEEDDARVVLFLCEDHIAAAFFMLRPIGDWVVMPRVFKRQRSKQAGKDI